MVGVRGGRGVQGVVGVRGGGGSRGWWGPRDGRVKGWVRV